METEGVKKKEKYLATISKTYWKSTNNEWIVSWKKFIEPTAQITGSDEAAVELAIEFVFAWIKDWVNHPDRKAGFLLPELGSFELNHKFIYKKVKNLSKMMRTEYRDSYEETYRWYVKAWKIAWANHIARTSTNRKFFPAKKKEESIIED